MNDSIKLSPKHGLNPSLVKCFWCGEDMGIALCGRLKGDIEAPRAMITGYEPCDKCREYFSQGILVAGYSRKALIDNLPSVGHTDKGEPLYLDGSHIVMTEQGISHFLSNQDEIDVNEVIEKRILFAPSELVCKIVQDVSKLQEEEQNEQSSSSTSVDNREITDKED